MTPAEILLVVISCSWWSRAQEKSYCNKYHLQNLRICLNQHMLLFKSKYCHLHEVSLNCGRSLQFTNTSLISFIVKVLIYLESSRYYARLSAYCWIGKYFPWLCNFDRGDACGRFINLAFTYLIS